MGGLWIMMMLLMVFQYLTDTLKHITSQCSAVSEFIQEQLLVGAISGPFGKVPFYSGPMALSPLNSIPRDDDTQRRIILNLS